MLKQQTKSLLQKYNIVPSKKLGQNFLIDESAVEALLNAAGISKKDVALEVGPGTGNITKELAKYAKKVLAIEKDKKLMSILKDELKKYDNIVVINEDILKLEIEELFRNLKLKIKNSDYKLIGAPPYYLTRRLFRHFLEGTKQPPKTVAVIIQKDVAEKIVAKPPKSNLLAISVQLYGEPKIARSVPKSAFWPHPKVDSAILTVKNIQKPVNLDEKQFFHILRAGFSAPRKQLAVNLSRELKILRPKIEVVLQKLNINPKTRAESLPVEQWKSLASAFTKSG